MTPNQAVVQGILKADGTLELDQKPNLPPGKVRVVVESIPEATQGSGLWAVLQQIWKEQNETGHVPRTKEEIDAEITALRDEWEQRMVELDKIREETPRRHEGPTC